MQRLLKQGALTFGPWCLAVLLITGCIVPSQEGLKKPEWPLQTAKNLKPDVVTSDKPLIKPTIPSEAGPAAKSGDTSEKTVPVSANSSENTIGVQGPATGRDTRHTTETGKSQGRPQQDARKHGAQKQEWEDQKVKQAAMEMAKESSDVKKIKLCYAATDDEWWVVLYHDAGGFLDLKQFVWNREMEKLEPFLVIKRIPPSRLERHLVENEAGRACETLDPRQTSSRP